METKICPYCGEEILATAKKCKHCGEWLDKSAMPSGVTSAARPQTSSDTASSEQVKPKKQEFSNSEIATGCAVGGGMVVLYWGIIIGVILFVLHITVPSRERMINCVLEDAVAEMQDQADNVSSLFGDDANLLTNLLTSTDAAQKGMMETILKYNHIEVEEGLFWTNAYLHNSKLGTEGEHVGFGILGITVPFVLWENLQLLDDGTSNSINEALDSVEEAVDEVVDEVVDEIVDEVDYELPDDDDF